MDVQHLGLEFLTTQLLCAVNVMPAFICMFPAVVKPESGQQVVVVKAITHLPADAQNFKHRERGCTNFGASEALKLTSC